MITEDSEMSGNVYANMAELHAQKMEENSKLQELRTENKKKGRVLRILVVLLIIMFFILAIFTSFLFFQNKSLKEEISYLQNNDKSLKEEISYLQNNDTEIMKHELQQLEKRVSKLDAKLEKSKQETMTEFTAQLKTYKKETMTEFTAQLKTYKKETKPSCESGWVEFAGHCYFFSTFVLNWKDAVDMCLNRQSHLVVITSAEEQSFLEKQSNGKEYWIGLTDEGTEDTFRWIDGTPYSFRSWQPGEPNNSGKREHCVHLHKGKWNDVVCSHNLAVICEKRMK